MAYTELSYTPINWKNRSESLETPLGKNNLNKMDVMIYNLVLQLREAYNELDLGKLDATDADGMVSGVEYDSATGIFTFSFFGTTYKKTVDLNIEKIPVSFSMDADGVITMKTTDGTKYTADLRKVIPVINKADTSTIEMSVASNGVTRTISANIKKNSITGDYLQPNYLADVTTQAGIATSQASLASSYASDAAYDAKLAQSYAVGGSGIRDGEASDNAKYYKEQTANIKSDVTALKDTTKGYMDNAKQSADNAYKSEANAKESEQNSAQSAAESETQAKLSKSYAVGDESARAGSLADNAKHYKERAENLKSDVEKLKSDTKTYSDNAKTSEENAKTSEDNAKQSETTIKEYFEQVKEIVDGEKDVLDEINKKLGIATFSVDDDGNLVYTEDSDYEFLVDGDGDLNYTVII